MASEERNALAELAEQLYRVGIELVNDQLDNESKDAVRKARRIIAELEKIRWWRSFSGWMPRGSDVLSILVKCREIAEEGAEV